MARRFLGGRSGIVMLLAALLVLPVLAGCSVPTGTVSGKVIFGTRPLPGGIVTFAPAQQGRLPASSEIDEQGNYQVTLPVGEYKISVDNSLLEPPQSQNAAPLAPPEGLKLPGNIKLPPAKAGAAPKDKGTGKASAGRYVAIPDRYFNSDKSGLSYTVVAGPQSHDIELK